MIGLREYLLKKEEIKKEREEERKDAEREKLTFFVCSFEILWKKPIFLTTP